MAKKQVTATESAAGAAAARAAKPKTATPRVRTVKHSKIVAAESAVAAGAAIGYTDAVSADTPQMPTDHHAEISRIAYSYWESRGYAGGSQDDDWLRAEQEYRQRSE
jgi:hypothetical protein